MDNKSDISQFEIKKTQIVLNVEYLSCKKCDSPLELNKYIKPDKEDDYCPLYVCDKCDIPYVIKATEPIYPILYSVKLGKDMCCELNHSIVSFLWKILERI